MAVAHVRSAYSGGGAAHGELVITAPVPGNLLVMFVSKLTAGEPGMTDNSGAGTWTVNPTKAVYNVSASELWMGTKIANGGETELKATVGTPEGICYFELSGTLGEVDKIEATNNVLAAKTATSNAYTDAETTDFLIAAVGANGASGALSAWEGTGPVLANVATTTGRCWAGWKLPAEVISGKTFKTTWTTEKVVGMLVVTFKPLAGNVPEVLPPTFRTPRSLYKPFVYSADQPATESVFTDALTQGLALVQQMAATKVTTGAVAQKLAALQQTVATKVAASTIAQKLAELQATVATKVAAGFADVSYASAVKADAPYAWWRMKSTAGEAERDLGSSPHNGTYHEPAKSAFGVAGIPREGAAVQFNVPPETNSWMSAEGGSVSGSWALELWVKPNELSNGTIFSTRFNGDNTFDMQITATGAVHCDVGDGTEWISTTADAAGALAVDRWHHIVFVATDKVGWKLYVNGVVRNEGTTTKTPKLWGAPENELHVGIGSFAAESAHVVVDELAIYTTALSGARIEAHYALGNTAPAQKLALSQAVVAGKLVVAAIAQKLAAKQATVATKVAASTIAQKLAAKQATVATKVTTGAVAQKLAALQQTVATKVAASTIAQRAGLLQKFVGEIGGEAFQGVIIQSLALRQTVAGAKTAVATVAQQAALRQTTAAAKTARGTVSQKLGLVQVLEEEELGPFVRVLVNLVLAWVPDKQPAVAEQPEPLEAAADVPEAGAHTVHDK